VYVVLLLAAVAILVGVVIVAMGRGGELVLFRRDRPELITRFRSPSDVASVRLPVAPLGYQVQATSDALIAAARLVAERDAEIVLLRRELNHVGAGPGETAPGDAEPGQDS
jgi:hypothetical protein